MFLREEQDKRKMRTTQGTTRSFGSIGVYHEVCKGFIQKLASAKQGATIFTAALRGVKQTQNEGTNHHLFRNVCEKATRVEKKRTVING